MPYGLEALAYARAEGYAVVPEGETDRLTCRYHHYPVLSVPGASAVSCLKAEQVRDIPKLYVIQEPGSSGQHFIPAMAQHLRKLGWDGQAYVIAMNGAKDPNELHKQDPDRFKEAFQAALEHAQPLPLDEHARVEEEDEETPPPPWPVLDANIILL
jgi:putative DNA primase/helicase